MIRNIKAGRAEFVKGKPLICVPLTSPDMKLIRAEALGAADADIVEWRIDSYTGDLAEGLSAIHAAVPGMPVLITLRTGAEGGASQADAQEYRRILKEVITELRPELADIEFSSIYSKELIELAKENSVISVVSSHDFSRTSSEEEIIKKLDDMEKAGADIPKIAQMPQSFSDVLTVLSATSRVAEHNFPIITMSMGKLGKISRLCGEVSGSALTFGAGQNSSAPGQIKSKLLREILDELSV